MSFDIRGKGFGSLCGRESSGISPRDFKKYSFPKVFQQDLLTRNFEISFEKILWRYYFLVSLEFRTQVILKSFHFMKSPWLLYFGKLKHGRLEMEPRWFVWKKRFSVLSESRILLFTTNINQRNMTYNQLTFSHYANKKFLFPLIFAFWTHSQSCKNWGVTDLSPLKESRPEIPKRRSREV